MKKWTIIILVILVLVVVALVVTSNPGTIDDNMDTSTMLAGPNALFVANQPSGESVTIMQTVLENGGYVVIHEDNNDSPGEIIGSSDLLDEGGHEDLEITLDRSSEEGETLYAMLHMDDGDGQFNPEDDSAITDENGNAVFMGFIIDDDADPLDEVAI